MTAPLSPARDSVPPVAPFDHARASVAPRRVPHVETPTHIAALAALECVVDGQSIAIASDAVGKIVEYEVSPLPLAREPLAGIGVLDGQIVLSLAPLSVVDTRPRRHTKGIVLRTSAAGVWTLEIAGVVAFVEATITAGSRHPTRPWLARAKTPDGREVVWLDVADLLRAISVS
jgi:hypothetical protein